MSEVLKQPVAQDPVPASLRAKWQAFDMFPLWESRNGALRSGPTESSRQWRWSEMFPIMTETVQVASPNIVERRVMQLVGEAGRASGTDATSGLMNATLQTIAAGESARPHRHSMTALRFVLSGTGAETVVEGKHCPMHPGDLILTPGMTWHQHEHHGGDPAIWLDVLDVNLHLALGTAKFQPGPVQQPAPTFDDATYATGGFLPEAAIAGDHSYSPMFRYDWATAKAAVDRAPPRPDGSRRMRYVNPVTGGACLGLIECQLIHVPAGCTTKPYRTTATGICSVALGSGASTIEDTHHLLVEKDVFSLPQHAWISHSGGEDGLYLFVASNDELYRRLGLLRVEENA